MELTSQSKFLQSHLSLVLQSEQRDTLEDSRVIIDFEKTGVQQLDNWASSLKMTSLFPLKGAY